MEVGGGAMLIFIKAAGRFAAPSGRARTARRATPQQAAALPPAGFAGFAGFFAGNWSGAWWCGDFLLTLQKISARPAGVARGSGRFDVSAVASVSESGSVAVAAGALRRFCQWIIHL